MSKRFGRNQKRRAREELQRLTDALDDTQTKLNTALYLKDHWCKRSTQLLGENIELYDEIEDIKTLVVNYSMVYAPQQVNVNWFRKDYHRAQDPLRLQPQKLQLNLEKVEEDFEKFGTRKVLQPVNLYTILADCTEDPMTRALWCNVQYLDNSYSLAVSPDFFWLKSQQQAVQHIATELARQMVSELKQKYGKKWTFK